jgi:hypothetical protein
LVEVNFSTIEIENESIQPDGIRKTTPKIEKTCLTSPIFRGGTVTPQICNLQSADCRELRAQLRDNSVIRLNLHSLGQLSEKNSSFQAVQTFTEFLLSSNGNQGMPCPAEPWTEI